MKDRRQKISTCARDARATPEIRIDVDNPANKHHFQHSNTEVIACSNQIIVLKYDNPDGHLIFLESKAWGYGKNRL